MMHDDELDATLRRYRLRDPGADLRRRVLDAASADARTVDVPWFWGPLAAAAIVCLWIGVHVSRIEPEPDLIREAEVAFLAEALGGDDDARRYAELVVPPPVSGDLPW